MSYSFLTEDECPQFDVLTQQRARMRCWVDRHEYGDVLHVLSEQQHHNMKSNTQIQEYVEIDWTQSRYCDYGNCKQKFGVDQLGSTIKYVESCMEQDLGWRDWIRSAS